MEWELEQDASGENRTTNVQSRSHTYEIYDTPLLLPIRAFRRTSRLALSNSLFFISQKRNGNVLRPLGLRLRVVVTVTNHVWVIAWTRDGFRRR